MPPIVWSSLGHLSKRLLNDNEENQRSHDGDADHTEVKRPNNPDDISVSLQLKALKEMLFGSRGRIPYAESHLLRAGRKR